METGNKGESNEFGDRGKLPGRKDGIVDSQSDDQSRCNCRSIRCSTTRRKFFTELSRRFYASAILLPRKFVGDRIRGQKSLIVDGIVFVRCFPLRQDSLAGNLLMGIEKGD